MITLDDQSVRTVVTPTNDAIVHALFLKRYERVAAGYVRLQRTLSAQTPELVARTGWHAAVDFLRQTPPEIQRTVLGYPSAVFWLDVAEELVRRESHLRFPEMHIRLHLQCFHRFAVAAARLVKGDYECETYCGENGLLVVPGAGEVLVGDAAPLEMVHVTVRSGDVRARSASEFLRLEDVPRTSNGVELNLLDRDLQLPGRTTFAFEQPSPENAIRWLSPLEHAFTLIRHVWPALTGELATGLRAIVPVVSNTPEVHLSASFREAPGLSALSWTADTAVVAEAIVHEYHHQKLNALLILDQLITGDATPRFYSPWRDDPRPLTGVLHGVYAFQAVLRFWAEALTAGIPLIDEDRLRQRAVLLRRQVERGIRTLKASATFTALGAALIDSIAEQVENCSLPIVAPAVAARIENKVSEHQEHWDREYAKLLRGSTTAAVSAEGMEDVLQWLGLDQASLFFPAIGPDALMEAVVRAGEKRPLSPLQALLGVAATRTVWHELTRGHIAYFERRYEEAVYAYGAAVVACPHARHLWHCLAFALRHLGKPEGDWILRHPLRAQSATGDVRDLKSLLDMVGREAETTPPA